ncbi:MAG TPA: hypothetical protein VFD65_01250, partial [Chitinophagales bacterium]|nr:hypothetical protein [Chitinophagales bacterium]
MALSTDEEDDWQYPSPSSFFEYRLHCLNSRHIMYFMLQSPNYSIQCNGQLFSLHQPVVMGILNLTEDSFYDGGW